MHTETETRIGRVRQDLMISAAFDRLMDTALTFARAEVRDPRQLRPETQIAEDNLDAAGELLLYAVDVHATDRAASELREAFQPPKSRQGAPVRTITASTEFYEQMGVLRDVALGLAKGKPYRELSAEAQTEIDGHESDMARLIDEYFSSLPVATASPPAPVPSESIRCSLPFQEALRRYARAQAALVPCPDEEGPERDAVLQEEEASREALYALVDGLIASGGQQARRTKKRKNTGVGYYLTDAEFVEQAMDTDHLEATLRRFGQAAAALDACYDKDGSAKPGKALQANRERFDGALDMAMALVRSYGAQCFAEGQRRGLED